MTYFVLGSHPQLSIAELKAVTHCDGERVGDLFLTEDDVGSLPNVQSRLAGTVKVGSIIGSFRHWNKEEAAGLIRSMIVVRDGKVQFGISGYGNGISNHLKPLGLEVKSLLKADGISSRLVTSKEMELSSVVVTKNHLLNSGGEFVVISYGAEILIGQTEAVQDFEAWSARDFGRPARDAKSGMLPPKLARLMINLSGVDPSGASILDPFCGSGTVLMEAGLMGFEKLYGSDISEKAIKDTKKNLEWMKIGAVLEVADAQTVALPHLVDVIITEPFLGPPQRGRESKVQIDQSRKELEMLYANAFSHLRTLLAPGSPLIVAFPVFGGAAVVTKPPLGFELQERLRYERSGQRVARDICRYVAI